MPANKGTSVIKAMSDTDVQYLFGGVSGQHAARDRALLTLLLNTGLRVAELTGLNVSDVYRSGAPADCLEVRAEIAKGGRPRTVPMNHAARGAVLDALAAAQQAGHGTEPGAPLFMSRKHCRMSPRAVQHMITECRGEKEWITPHSFRHTFATRVLRATGNIRVTQKLLGHASITTTTIYTHPGLQDLSAAVAAI